MLAREIDNESGGVEISAQMKTPHELLDNLKRVLKEIEVKIPKSFDYLLGLDLESDLMKVTSNPNGA